MYVYKKKRPPNLISFLEFLLVCYANAYILIRSFNLYNFMVCCPDVFAHRSGPNFVSKTVDFSASGVCSEKQIVFRKGSWRKIGIMFIKGICSQVLIDTLNRFSIDTWLILYWHSINITIDTPYILLLCW